MLEIKDLSVRAGGFHLTGISLSVRSGTFHVIMGPTGAGKTLLLECIAGLRTPHSGELLLEGKDLARVPVEQRQIGFLPQDLALFPHLTVKGNILYGLRRRNPKGDGGERRVAELCDALSIAHLLERDVGTLSGGEKQRVALARALVPGCRLLLLDEPFTALHRGMRKDLWFLLKGLQEELGVTVLMVTHDVEEALFLGDMLSVLIEGSIRQTGTKREVFGQPNSVEVARLMGIRNFFRGRILRAEEREVHVRCEDLNGTFVGLRPLHSNMEFVEGSPVTLGIRAEEVAILSEKDLESGSDNTLSGVVTTILEKGGSYILLFKPAGTESQIEIEKRIGRGDAWTLQAGNRVTARWSRESLLFFPVGCDIESLPSSSWSQGMAGIGA